MAIRIRAQDAPVAGVDGGGPFYSVAEAAKMLGVHPATIWRWIESGKLPATRIGARKIRIRVADVRTMTDEARDASPAASEPAVRAWRPTANHAEIARRQALVKEILEDRKTRVISPLTSVDLIRLARQRAAGVDDAG